MRFEWDALDPDFVSVDGVRMPAVWLDKWLEENA